ncbi:MAG: hypothetical protein J2P50_09450 [Hyphomicrobiaceae bacterium]|nr:hypothetical protein [Hyphomicrobiaceae bacterium]
MKYLVGMAAVLTVAGAVSAPAQSLQEQQYRTEQEAELAREVAIANKGCETSVTAKFDWSAMPADRGGAVPYAYCRAVLEGMRRVCENPMGKDAVKEKIKSITCSFGSNRSIALKDGAIDYKIEFRSVNDADFVFEYLQNNL